MIKLGVPFGDTLGDSRPSAVKAPWDLQNVSYAFLVNDEQRKRFLKVDAQPSSAQWTALTCNPACRITFTYVRPSRFLNSPSANDFKPDSIKGEWAINKTFGNSWYVGTSATTEISPVKGVVHDLLQWTRAKTTLARRSWHMMFDNPTYLVSGASLDLVSRQPTYFFSWGAPYPWLWKPEFKPPHKLVESIEKKQAKMIADVRKSFLDQQPDMENVTDQVMEMYDSVFSDMFEPLQNLRAYHDSPDGPLVCIGETNLSGQFNAGSGTWALTAAHNWDGWNKFVLQAEGQAASSGVDVTFKYNRQGVFRQPLSLQLSHNSRTAQTVVGFWRPLFSGLGLQASYNVGTKRVGAELTVGSHSHSIGRLTLDCPAFDAKTDLKESKGGDGKLELAWDLC